MVAIFIVCFFGIWYALPNFVSSSFLRKFDVFPKDRISLGLDLQGGSSLLLEVDVKTAIDDYLDFQRGEVRRILRKARVGYTGGVRIEGNTLKLRLRKPEQASLAKKELSKTFTNMPIQVTGEGELRLEFPEEAISERETMAVDQSIEIVRRRIDEMGTKEPSIQRQGRDRILLQLPGVDNPSEVKRILGKTAKLTFRLIHPTMSAEEALQGHVPPDSEVLYDYIVLEGHPPRPYLVKKAVEVTGDMLLNAYGGTNSETNQPAIFFQFDKVGAQRFASVTRRNVGRPFAIVLDNKVVQAPSIRGPIPNGSGLIDGHFTYQEVNEVALLLRAGALPAPLKVLEERTVGPDLGADSIAAGKMATLIAVVMVFVFMFIFYGFRFGTIANIGLFMNLVLLMASLSFLGATLTLPGIAGIALTLGMAVDANVLIFERIKEELRVGQAPVSAVSMGYSRAMATIVDSNITTLIGAFLLYYFGSGPIRGFAVTLGFGIIISMFTAVSLTRILVLLWLKRHYAIHKGAKS